MAFLGSLGKAFGISTPEAANIATSFATGGLGAAIGTTIGSLGTGSDVRPRTTFEQGRDFLVDGAPMETSPNRPAGVDSPATVSRVSQTSMAPQQAFIGGFGVPGLATGLIGGAARALTRPSVGGLIGGLGAGAAAEFVMDQFGNQKKLVITRKLQRDTKKLFMMTGGNIDIVSQQSLFFLGKDLSPEQVLAVLFKTFKNQGPYVTKAAVRKTRATIRKMETLCDLKDRLCPPKPARRRAPARKSTMITQVK